MGRILLWYLPAVNLLTFAVFWLDKRRAQKGKRRLSERELLGWTAVGGSFGAYLAMRRFRHKTRKRSFRMWFWVVVALQIALLIYVATRHMRD